MLMLVLLGASGAEPILAPTLLLRAGGGGGDVEGSLVGRYVVVVVVDGVFYHSDDVACWRR